ncbi:MAG TPA: hypothetical protein VGK59_21720 [Ohtaekwangia sp.]
MVFNQTRAQDKEFRFNPYTPIELPKNDKSRADITSVPERHLLPGILSGKNAILFYQTTQTMIFVFTSVLAFFAMLFLYADKMNKEAERQGMDERSGLSNAQILKKLI